MASGDSAYFAWNDAIAARFFSPDFAGQSVYLFITEDVVRDVGRTLGRDYDDFLAAVRGGPPNSTRTGHCQRALQVAHNWRSRGLPYPPYILYLSLFVLAGGLEGDFDPRSYYPRVWELLGEDGEGTPPSFERMLELWDDLEKWSVRDRDGELGMFEARIVGGKIHIGLPLAQTMLTEEERHALPRIFDAAGLEPGASPSDKELRRALTVYGRSALRARTRHAVEQQSGRFTAALLDVISEEYLEWTGDVPDVNPQAAPRAVAAGLRLCLDIDPVAGTIRTTLRCHSKRPLPEGGLSLEAASLPEPLSCDEFVPGWSSPLTAQEGGFAFSPPAAVWRSGLSMRDPRAGWAMRLHPARLRVFVEGREEQLPGLIETSTLPFGPPFYLTATEDAMATLGPWLSEDCVGWEPLSILSGLPPGWAFGTVRSAGTDRGPRSLDDRISFSDRCTLRLTGGVAAGARNTFFHFAPPDVLLDGAHPDDVVVCHGEALQLSTDDGGSRRYTLPASAAPDTRVGIEVNRDGEAIRRRSVYLVSGVSWQRTVPQVVIDGYGRATPDGEGGISGALGPAEHDSPFLCDPLRTPGLGSAAPRVYLMGRIPGQLADWPEEPLPDWPAVWAIPFGQRGRALYCGDGDLTDAAPATGSTGHKDARRWRAFLWRTRKRISPPTDRALKAIWREYLEAARGG